MDRYIERGVFFVQPHEHRIVEKGQGKKDLKGEGQRSVRWKMN